MLIAHVSASSSDRHTVYIDPTTLSSSVDYCYVATGEAACFSNTVTVTMPAPGPVQLHSRLDATPNRMLHKVHKAAAK